MKGYTFYSKNAGVEVKATTAVKETEGSVAKEGRVTMRFFSLGKDSKAFRFVMRPDEALSVGKRALQCAENGKTQTITHNYQGAEAKFETKISFERYDLKRDGSTRHGYAATLEREKEKVNVPMTQDAMVFVGELLVRLALDQAWNSFKGPDGEVEKDDSDTVTETEDPKVEVEEPVKTPEPEKAEVSAKSESAKDETEGLKRVKNLQITALTKTGLPVVKIGETDVYASRKTKQIGDFEIKEGQVVDVVLSGNGKFIEEICAA